MSDFWTQCLEALRRDTPAEVFQNWFSDLSADCDLDADQVTIFAPSGAKLRTVQASYANTLQAVINRHAGREIDLVWSVRSRESSAAEENIPAAPASRDNEQEAKAEYAKTGLLANLTFENMVEGQANQMAYAAALQVASSPQSIYNPLFIYGGVGLGKTHLMHAIGNRFLKDKPNAKVLCVSAQEYIRQFVDAMRMKNVNNDRYTEAMQKFEARYRGLDLLLIDDIQSFASRDGTQANFFLTFESMVPHGKQIVLTSDTYPKNLSEFQDRLLSRLTQGLIVMIEPPEFEMRVQILLQKAERSGIEMPQEVAEIIAKRVKSNVRELEGAVQQILAYTRFHQVPVTLETAKMALRDIFKATATPVTIDNSQKAVAEYYGIKTNDIVAKSRKANLVRARQVAMYLSKDLTNKSLPEIGALFGGRDHTTVIYAHRKVISERNTDDGLKHDIHLLEQRLKN